MNGQERAIGIGSSPPLKTALSSPQGYFHAVWPTYFAMISDSKVELYIILFISIPIVFRA